MDSPKKYGKNYVQMVCTKQLDNKTNYLIYTRDVEPFLGCSGFPSGKIDWGEKVSSAATRELFEETGLKGESKLVAVIHYLFTNESGEFIQEEYMYVCHFDEPQGKLVSSVEGVNRWIPESNLSATLAKPFVPIDNYFRIVDLVKEDAAAVKFFEILSSTKDF